MGIAALILGIISIIIGFIPLCGSIAFIPAVVGLILGIVDTVQKSKKDEKKGISIAGIVLSALAIVIISLWVFLFGVAISNVDGNQLNSLAEEFSTEFSTSLNEYYTTNYEENYSNEDGNI